MKILEICTGFPLSFQGGITNYVRSLAQQLYECGNEVYVLGDEDNEKYEFHYVGYRTNLNGFVYGPLRDKKGLKWLKIFLEREKFDVIHVHMCINIDWDLYELLNQYHYIVSLHDYFFICPRITMIDNCGASCEKYEEEKCKKCISYLHRLKAARYIPKLFAPSNSATDYMPHVPQKISQMRYEKFRKLLEQADYVLPVSNRVGEIYSNSGINANYKTLHIGNISANEFDNRKAHVSDGSRVNLVYLGRLSYYKGVNILTRIADEIDHGRNSIHFWGYSGKYKDLLRDHGILDHGKYDQNQLSDILSNMDIGLVLPIWEDNGPQVVMEMLNNKLPVIATRMGGIPDFINEDNGYLFNPNSNGDIEKVCSYINGLTKDDILRMKLKINRTISPAEHCTAICDIYKEIMGKTIR